jgi:hypothetical protein
LQPLIVGMARGGKLTYETIVMIWKASQTSDEKEEFLEFCLAIFAILSRDDLVNALRGLQRYRLLT